MSINRNLALLATAANTTGFISTANLTGTIALSQLAVDTSNANNITTGTLPSAQLSGSYTGITGVGTLAAGSIPSSLITGLPDFSTANVQTFLSTGTWTKPSGVSMARIQLWGGGGGGRSGNGNYPGGGGGGGAYVELVVPISYLASSLTATVAAGGAINGQGGDSSVSFSTAYLGRSSVVAYGGGPGGYQLGGSGSGGGGGGSTGAGGAGNGYTSGGAGGGMINGVDGGGYGYPTACAATVVNSLFGGGGGGVEGQTGANSLWGGAGGGGGSITNPGATASGGGTSIYGGNGGAGSNGTGSAGTQPGGGGGGARGTGAVGGAGKIVITCW
jgi:hypothetical protein